MGLDIALDELYSTGWAPLDTSGCSHDVDGRAYPTAERVRREFVLSGHEFQIRHVQNFDCWQAEWTGPDGESGSVVGLTEAEAAVYALAQMRRRAASAAAV